MGKSFFVLLLLLLASACAYAQEVNATIRGTVTDPTGSVVPNATVILTDTGKNTVVRTLTTGSGGQYTASFVPVGRYSVSAEGKGFAKTVVSNITATANGQLTVDLNLEVLKAASTVNVEGSAAQVNLESPTASGVFSQRQITELPTNNRNYEQFVALAAPGISAGVSDEIYVGVTNPSGLSNQINFSVNGSRPTQNNWTLDGIDNVDRGANLTLLDYPSIDALNEFTVLRGQYNPEYGRSSSGQINVITKSGSSEFHGDAYEFFRNDALDGNNYFSNLAGISRPPLRYNDFGYTLGGPVFIPKLYPRDKSHTFFFFSQEFRKVINYTNFASGEVPTPAEQAGTFAAPVCLNAACTQTGTQVPSINPTAQAYIKDIFSKLPPPQPDPQTGVPTYRFVGRNIYDFRQEIIRFDHYFGQKVQLTGRYLTDSIPTQEPGGLFTGSSLPGVPNTITNSPGHNLVVRATVTLTPNLVNETGYGYSYGAVISNPVGLDASVNSPDIKPTLPFVSEVPRIPSLSFANGESIAGFGPYLDYNRNHEAYDNLSWVHGNHSFKFGGVYNYYTKDENSGGNNVGTFTFPSDDPTGTSTFQQEFASFLEGNVAQYTQLNIDPRAVIHQNQFEAFAQDAWRIRSNFTFSYGVRYSLFLQPTDGNGRLASFDPALYNPADAPQIDPTSGLLVAGTATPILNGVIVNGKNSPYGNAVARTPKRDFAPRVGFAWDPTGKGKTSVRSGYGIFYDSPAINIVENNVLNNPPFVNNISISNTLLNNPASVTPDVNLAPLALYATQPNWSQPYTQQWSFDVQHELAPSLILDTGYYGQKGTHLVGVIDINEPSPGAYLAAGLTPNGAPIDFSTTPLLNAVRPYKGFDAINMFSPRFNSNYNSLQVQVTKRFSEGSSVVVNYTWSHALTDAQSDYITPQNTYDIAAEYGPAQFDRRHILTGNWTYELPFFKSQSGLLGHVLGGWEWNGVIVAQTGLPLTVTGGNAVDPAGLGLLDGQSFAGRRPDQVGNPDENAARTRVSWFNTSAFANIPAGEYRAGDAPRGAVRGPGTQRWDMGLYKSFKLVERFHLQFRAEAFNVFNHTNFDTVSTSLASSLFGQVLSSRDPRILQLGLKAIF